MIEVERRTCYKFDVPSDAVLRKCCNIQDTYYSISPIYRRLRVVETCFPNRSVLRFYSEKIKGKEMLEIEFPLSNEEFDAFERELNRIYKAPLFKVSGHRKEYRIENRENLTLCFDDIDQLGEWREAEIMVKDESQINEALSIIYSTFNSFGVPSEAITSDTYPEIIYGLIRK